MNDIKESVKWHVLITSHANAQGLTYDQLQQVFESYKDDDNVSFRKKCTKSALDEFNAYSVAVWQVTKSNEMENLFFENMKYSIDNDMLSFNVEYDVMLPESFTAADVAEWAEGVGRIRLNYISSGAYVSKWMSGSMDLIEKESIDKMLNEFVSNGLTDVKEINLVS